MTDQNQEQFSEQYRKKVQRRVLAMMKQKLDEQEMDATRAQNLSAYVLEKVHKGMPQDQIYDNVKRFDVKTFPELLEVSVMFIKEHVEILRQTLVGRALKFLKIGNFNQVNQIIDKVED